MAAARRDSGAGLSLRRPRRLEDDFGIESLPCCGHELYCMNGSSALRQAGAFLMDRSKAGLFAGGLVHAAHHAVMLAISAAAGGEARLGIRDKQRRDQRQAENHQQRMCDRAAHRVRMNLTQIELANVTSVKIGTVFQREISLVRLVSPFT